MEQPPDGVLLTLRCTASSALSKPCGKFEPSLDRKRVGSVVLDVDAVPSHPAPAHLVNDAEV